MGSMYFELGVVSFFKINIFVQRKFNAYNMMHIFHADIYINKWILLSDKKCYWKA